jgi:hypothetical protein
MQSAICTARSFCRLTARHPRRNRHPGLSPRTVHLLGASQVGGQRPPSPDRGVFQVAELPPVTKLGHAAAPPSQA